MTFFHKTENFLHNAVISSIIFYKKSFKKGYTDDFGLKFFTPLESPAACSGDGDKIPFGANTGFKAPCEPSRWKVRDLLTGFTI
jgi:hypothetical protein